VLAPKKSIVRELYESHARPFARVVCGLLPSWGQHTATTTRPSVIRVVTWSPCNKFIAITFYGAKTIDVLDSVTLQKLQTLNPQQELWRGHARPALIFSPDSRILTSLGYLDGKRSFESWDLQTGDEAGIIRWESSYSMKWEDPSITYSANGKMIGVRCRSDNVILIFDIASGAQMHSYSTAGSILPTNDIWAHEESFRFTTLGRKTITIWEVGFTSDAGPTRVEILPTPENIHSTSGMVTKFLPAPCRLALNLEDEVMVWDVQNSKYLLRCNSTSFSSHMSFSSNGRLFACSTKGSEIYVWKESPTGYTLHGVPEHESYSMTLFSPNGEWIVAFGGSAMRLWRTNGFTTPPSRRFSGSPRYITDFLLDFSPDGMLAVVARRRDNRVTTIDLSSGVPRLTIDAGTKVYGLRVNGNNTITVIGDREVVTWDLPTGNLIPDAKATREDSTRTIHLRGSIYGVTRASISPSSSYVATTTASLSSQKTHLCIHDASTGEQIFGGEPVDVAVGHNYFFAPEGCNLLIYGRKGFSISDGRVERWDEVDVEAVGGYPWKSSRGYQITNDWWILDPEGKRLLMLPAAWQFPWEDGRVWKEQFLALPYGELPEAVILELNQ